MKVDVNKILCESESALSNTNSNPCLYVVDWQKLSNRDLITRSQICESLFLLLYQRVGRRGVGGEGIPGRGEGM